MVVTATGELPDTDTAALGAGVELRVVVAMDPCELLDPVAAELGAGVAAGVVAQRFPQKLER